MKIKTSELTGVALDWAVAYTEGLIGQIYIIPPDDENDVYALSLTQNRITQCYEPSTDWAQGGPIIEREGICTKRQLPASVGYEWNAWQHTKFGNGDASGSTPLIAAMRCYVASKIGDEIDVPEELL